ncbi:MAG: hypothetical protein O2779_03765 [Nanoarchaeota archaeon]|nr:hypothetical protein [Nanoarchaeota archaeon]
MKKHEKKHDVIGVLFLAAGLITALSPHATHMAAGHPGTHTHELEIIVGLVVAIFGLIVLIINNDAWKK